MFQAKALHQEISSMEYKNTWAFIVKLKKCVTWQKWTDRMNVVKTNTKQRKGKAHNKLYVKLDSKRGRKIVRG